jgi:hypothetical protein
VAGRHYYRTSAAQSGALFALTLLAAARPVWRLLLGCGGSHLYRV